MNRIQYYCWRLREIFCQHFHIIHLFETKVGIKGIYGMKALPLTPITSDLIACSSEELFLGIDFLKDDYTLLDCPLKKSPHFELMRTLLEKQGIEKTEYIRRYENGILDGRVASLKHSSYEYFENAFQKRLDEIKSDIIEPIYIYRIGGRSYVYDGKHRAALCALLGKTIKCYEVSNDRFGMSYRLISGKNAYSKHLELFKKYKEEKKQFI